MGRSSTFQGKQPVRGAVAEEVMCQPGEGQGVRETRCPDKVGEAGRASIRLEKSVMSSLLKSFGFIL